MTTNLHSSKISKVRSNQRNFANHKYSVKNNIFIRTNYTTSKQSVFNKNSEKRLKKGL